MSTEFDPQPGDRCHWHLWTDVEPCTVLHRTPRRVTVQMNKARLTTPPKLTPGGFAAVVDEPAQWEILDELEEGQPLTFSLRSNGRWKMVGDSANSPGNVLRPGWRKFYDYGF